MIKVKGAVAKCYSPFWGGRKIAQIGQTESRSCTQVLREAKFVQNAKLCYLQNSSNDKFFPELLTPFRYFRSIHSLYKAVFLLYVVCAFCYTLFFYCYFTKPYAFLNCVSINPSAVHIKVNKKHKQVFMFLLTHGFSGGIIITRIRFYGEFICPDFYERGLNHESI